MTNIITELSLTKANVCHYYFLKNMNLYSLPEHATFAQAIQLATDKGYEISLKSIKQEHNNLICSADELLNNFSQLEM